MVGVVVGQGGDETEMRRSWPELARAFNFGGTYVVYMHL